MSKTKIKTKAQATIEFVMVFLILIAMLFILIELALYWRARYATETVASLITANAQLEPLPLNEFSCPAADKALEVLILRGTPFLMQSPVFSKVEEYQQYTYTSQDQVMGEPRLILEVDCSNIKNNKLRVSLRYRYRGIMLYTGGTNIFSSSNFSSQKY